jgi:bifunctional non-homologous end joining protein LigD
VKERIPFRVSPMLPTLVRKPFHHPGWVYEEKYDGGRILAYKEGRRVQLFSRNAIDHSARFPRIVQAIADLPPATLLLDGEVVVLDQNGISRFQLLQQGKGEPIYAVFDCLFYEGEDLRSHPLSARRPIIGKLLKKKSLRLRSPRGLAKNGLQAFRAAQDRGYEGLLAKDLSSPYVERRSTHWLKVKVRQEDEFVIGGYTPPGGGRHHFGALLLGAHQNGKLRYVGKVGTGFDFAMLAALYRRFQPLIRVASPFLQPLRERGVTFIAPRLVAQISYQEWTTDMKLRQPVFLGLRDDKRPEEVVLPSALG